MLCLAPLTSSLKCPVLSTIWAGLLDCRGRPFISAISLRFSSCPNIMYSIRFAIINDVYFVQMELVN